MKYYTEYRQIPSDIGSGESSSDEVCPVTYYRIIHPKIVGVAISESGPLVSNPAWWIIQSDTHANRVWHQQQAYLLQSCDSDTCEVELTTDLWQGILQYLPISTTKSQYQGLGQIVARMSPFPSQPTAIAGVLELISKVKYGANSRGVPIFRFRPLEFGWPWFMVASTYLRKHPKVNSSVYAVINFHHWPITQKWPTGHLQSVVGEVGDFANLCQATLFRFSLVSKSIPAKIIRDLVSEPWPSRVTSIRRTDFRGRRVFSIDPPGCRDIDDALHLSGGGDSDWEVGIHIADVGSLIGPDSELDRLVRNRLTSIYGPTRQINMLPDQLATDRLSLLPGCDRPALSLVLSFSYKTMEFQQAELQHCWVKSNKAFSYLEASQLWEEQPESEWGKTFSTLVELSKGLPNFRAIPDGNKLELIHHLIETWMVYYNHWVALWLVESLPSQTILRTHQSSEQDRGQVLWHAANQRSSPKLLKFLEKKHYQSAQYSAASSSTSHFGLGLNHYLHFTSPLRRYVDLYHHQLCYTLLEKGSTDSGYDDGDRIIEKDMDGFNMFGSDAYDCQEGVNHLIQDLNCRQGKIRKWERLVPKLSYWNQIKDLSPEVLPVETGYIIEFVAHRPEIIVYLDRLDWCLPIKLSSSKLESLYTWQVEAKSAQFVQAGGSMEEMVQLRLELCQPVTIKIYPDPSLHTSVPLIGQLYSIREQ